MHLAMPASQDLFSSALMESGGFSGWQPMKLSEQWYSKLLNQTGCPDVACLLALPADQLRAAYLQIPHGRCCEDLMGNAFIPWAPTVDGVELAQHPLDLAKAGKVNRVPTVIGTNMDDGASWSLDYNQTESDFKAMFAKQYGSAAAAEVYLNDSEMLTNEFRPRASHHVCILPRGTAEESGVCSRAGWFSCSAGGTRTSGFCTGGSGTHGGGGSGTRTSHLCTGGSGTRTSYFCTGGSGTRTSHFCTGGSGTRTSYCCTGGSGTRTSHLCTGGSGTRTSYFCTGGSGTRTSHFCTGGSGTRTSYFCTGGSGTRTSHFCTGGSGTRTSYFCTGGSGTRTSHLCTGGSGTRTSYFCTGGSGSGSCTCFAVTCCQADTVETSPVQTKGYKRFRAKMPEPVEFQEALQAAAALTDDQRQLILELATDVEGGNTGRVAYSKNPTEHCKVCGGQRHQVTWGEVRSAERTQASIPRGSLCYCCVRAAKDFGLRCRSYTVYRKAGALSVWRARSLLERRKLSNYSGDTCNCGTCLG
ncbi:unnamed protein product [Effrenium voratum]|nr:unnamed protein product [Effrenium voratum]